MTSKSQATASRNDAALESPYSKSLARLTKIQKQLRESPGGQRLKDKVCIITGVNSLQGIGRATALRYAKQGVRHLYLLDISDNNLSNLEETISKLDQNVKVTTIKVDVTDESTISNVCNRAITEEARLDVFFANAGIAGGFRGLSRTTTDEFMETLRINTISAFIAAKHASAAMLKTDPNSGKDEPGGSIIFTSSLAGLVSIPGSIAYSASKAAVSSMAKTIAYTHHLRGKNVRVNAICPGIIETGMTQPLQFDNSSTAGFQIGQLNPLERYGAAEEVASIALFLASDDSSYVNGQSIVVDGGWGVSAPLVNNKTGN